jgi:hypothetical protein
LLIGQRIEKRGKIEVRSPSTLLSAVSMSIGQDPEAGIKGIRENNRLDSPPEFIPDQIRDRNDG